MNIESGRRLLPVLKQCAIKAGIYQDWFLSFGTLLGAVRPSPRSGGQMVQGFIEHDDDMDIGIFDRNITKDQIELYLTYLSEMECFKFRHGIQRRTDNNIPMWFTMQMEKEGTKCCHWIFFEHKDFMWHSKGREWINDRKFPFKKYNYGPQDEAIAKGLPAQHLRPGHLLEIDFEGGKYNIPVRFGHCLDFWYPQWDTPVKGGSSKAEFILKVTNWNAPGRWVVF